MNKTAVFGGLCAIFWLVPASAFAVSGRCVSAPCNCSACGGRDQSSSSRWCSPGVCEDYCYSGGGCSRGGSGGGSGGSGGGYSPPVPVFNFPKVDIEGAQRQKEAQSQQYNEAFRQQRQAGVSAYAENLKRLVQQRLENLEKRRKKEDTFWENYLRKLEQERNALRAAVDALWEKNKGRIPQDLLGRRPRGGNVSVPQIPLPPDPGASLEQFQQHELDMNRYMSQMSRYYKGQAGILKAEIADLKKQEARLTALGEPEKGGQKQAGAEARAKSSEEAGERKSALEARQRSLQEKMTGLVKPQDPGPNATPRERMMYEFKRNKYDDQLADYRRQLNSANQELNSLQAQGLGPADKPLEIKRMPRDRILIVPDSSMSGSAGAQEAQASQTAPEIRRVQPPPPAPSPASGSSGQASSAAPGPPSPGSSGQLPSTVQAPSGAPPAGGIKLRSAEEIFNKVGVQAGQGSQGEGPLGNVTNLEGLREEADFQKTGQLKVLPGQGTIEAPPSVEGVEINPVP